MKRYGEYTNIGLPWYPDGVPSHWTILRHKNVLTKHKELVGENSDKYTLLSLTLNGVIIRDLSEGKGKFSKDYDKYVIVNEGDFVFCLFDVDETPRTVGLSKHHGMITGAYDVFTPHDINSDYFFYYYLALDNNKLLKPLYTGLRKVIAYPTFISIKFPVPPRSEQNQIVRFLDYKTARIDKLISGYKRQIELLEERKRKIENDSIVNGINPNVAYKDTSAKWMCKVPAHWQEMRTKNFFSEINIRSENGEEPHLTMSQKYGLVTDDEFTQKRLLSEDYKGAKLCWKDDIVLNRLKAHLGVFALSPILGVISPDYTVIRMNQQFILPEYALKLFRCQSFRGELITRVKGIVEGFWRLYTEDFGEIRVCIPPIEEQKHILDYVKTKENQINQAINGINKQITLLQEYRIRLISDVVTGQIDVRDEIIPEQ
jgi:type I restriction enzyme S subunit